MTSRDARLTGVLNDSNPQFNQRYLYDELDRLTSGERGDPVQSRTGYRYDLSGNRTEKIQDNTTVTKGTIDPNSNRHSLAVFVWPLFKVKQTSTYIC
jgi:hypothetical protein